MHSEAPAQPTAPGTAPSKLLHALAVAVPGACLLVGWRVFWFLTDDAFIAFRYVANRRAGHGYVWNAPPFLPVEGYTSLLWVMLLDAVWSLTGVEPPEAANALALCFSIGTVAVTVAMLLRMELRSEMARWRPLWIFLVLAGCASNRTFLAWMSSGLETALFDFLLVAWVAWTLFTRPGVRSFLPVASTLAMLAYLARPDGVLLVLASGVLALLAVCGRGRSPRGSAFAALGILCAVPAHLLWRRAFYGAWVPNTYVAKYVGAWPESGARYLLSFVLEYAWWVWIAVALMWAVRRLRGGGARTLTAADALPGRLAIATVVAHAAYYTFVIGGDHFEYRVYNQLIPLLFVSCIAMLDELDCRPRSAALVFASMLALSLPIPWTHWSHSQVFDDRRTAFRLILPVADLTPARWLPYASVFDASQRWLIEHSVCMRHQEHKVFWRTQHMRMPDREIGRRLGPDGHPTLAVALVGVPGWTLPNVHIIDMHGLNDYVIARTPVDTTRPLEMAHSRSAPLGYAEGFRSNVWAHKNKDFFIARRRIPLTGDEIAAHEREWRAWADAQARSPDAHVPTPVERAD